MRVTHTIGRALDRVAPSVAQRLRDLWYTANGGRSETLGKQLEQQIQGLGGLVNQRTQAMGGLLSEQMHGHRQHVEHRLDGLQAQHDAARRRLDDIGAGVSRLMDDGGNGAAFVLQDSLRRLNDAGEATSPRIAVVSVLPPMETGIAEYTLRTFEAAPVGVDIFAPFPDAAAYLAAVHRLPRRGGPLAIHGLAALSYALATRRYQAVIWVMGNSDHHLPVLRLLRETRHLDPLAPNWLQLHDPVLFNLARLHAERHRLNLAVLLRGAALAEIPSADWNEVATGHVASIIGEAGLAARALFADLPLHGVILHSRAARDILLPAWPDLDALEQRDLYLPVLEPFAPRAQRPAGGLRIGSFGYPARSKGTDAIMATFRRLRQEHPGASLVLAGFNVARYAQEEGLCGEPGLELHDNPPMGRLGELMNGVDVAMQLRKDNAGESSGIIPQLLSRDIPILASDIGAFTEYGGAVRLVPVSHDPEALAAAILEETAQPALRRAARRVYVEQHGPAAFCAALLSDGMAAPTRQRA